MKTERADERPLELNGAEEGAMPGSIKDWRSDRLAQSFKKLDALLTTAAEAITTTPPPAVSKGQALLGNLEKEAASAPVHVQDEIVKGVDELSRLVDTVGGPSALTKSQKDSLAALSTLAQIQFDEAAFYGVSAKACSSEVRLEKFCDRAQAMVNAGYVGERELEGVSVALSDGTSARGRLAEIFHGVAVDAGFSLSRNYESVSYFQDDASKLGGPKSDPKIIVSADQEREFAGALASTVSVFTHELGHFLARDKMPEMVRAGVEAVVADGGPDAKYAPQLFPARDLAEGALERFATQDGGLLTQPMRQESSLAVPWSAMVLEMQGDLMRIAGAKAEFGNEAAIREAQNLIEKRLDEQASWLADMSSTPGGTSSQTRFVEEHNTVAALKDFVGRIENGELDAVRTPAQLDKLMGESIVRGLMEQHETARGAELNVHHIVEGKTVAGTPPGLDMRDILLADMANPLSHHAGQPTVLLSAEQAKQLPSAAPIIEVTGPGSEKLYLSSMAPSGVTLPVVSDQLHQVDKYPVTESMVPYVKQLVAERDGIQASSIVSIPLTVNIESATLSERASMRLGGKDASILSTESNWGSPGAGSGVSQGDSLSLGSGETKPQVSQEPMVDDLKAKASTPAAVVDHTSNDHGALESTRRSASEGSTGMTSSEASGPTLSTSSSATRPFAVDEVATSNTSTARESQQQDAARMAPTASSSESEASPELVRESAHAEALAAATALSAESSGPSLSIGAAASTSESSSTHQSSKEENFGNPSPEVAQEAQQESERQIEQEMEL